jgi:hypothetical protein
LTSILPIARISRKYRIRFRNFPEAVRLERFMKLEELERRAPIQLSAFILALSMIASAGFSSSRDAPETDAKPSLRNTEATRSSEKQSAASAKHEFQGPRSVLRAGEYVVDVMELTASPRFVELGLRLQKAATADPKWWMEKIKNAKPGEPLAYEPRFGLSPEEYNEFLALGKKKAMRKKSEATIELSENGNDVFVFSGGESLPNLTRIEVDLKGDLVRTPFGVAKNRVEIHANEASALGPWNGVQWESDTDAATVFSQGTVKLAIGTLESSGRAVLYYTVKKLGASGVTDISHVLLYDASAPVEESRAR